MDEYLEVLKHIPQEEKDNMDKQYQSWKSTFPKVYIGLDWTGNMPCQINH